MNNGKAPRRLPVDVRQALQAICAYGKGRCWYCDAKLPKARKAIRDGWDVQRVEGQPVASIILVCPSCLRQDQRVQVTGYRVQHAGTGAL
ncbi:MAG TPA: hypothetical protein VGW33_13150 [Terriglobia bacterium]|nr:hypothetical protein [Terriglobia bacterium]